MKKYILQIALMLMAISAYAQSQKMALKDWESNVGTQTMFQKNVTKTDGSGNVYTAGATLNTNGKYDILIRKVSSGGSVIFTQVVNGAANEHDFAMGLLISGTDIYVTGAITNNTLTLAPDLFIAKYNSSGTQQFFTTFSNGYGDVGKDIVINATYNYIIVAGASYNSNFDSDMLAVVFDSGGNQQYYQTIDYNAANDGAFKVTTRSNLFTITGPVTQSLNNYKLASQSYSIVSGLPSGSVTVGATATSSVEIISDLTTDGAGNMYICGATQQNAGQGYDYYVAKITSSLTVTWEQTINGYSGSSSDDFAKGIKVNSSGDVFVTGITTHSTQGKNITTVKLNSSGVVQWTVNENGSFNGNDGGTDLDIDGSSNVFVTGYKTAATNNTDIYSVKYNSSGIKVWEITDAYPLNDEGTNLIIDNGDIVIAGSRQKNNGTYEYITYKYTEKDIIVPVEIGGQVNDKTFLFYENIGQEMDETLSQISSKKFITNSSPKYYFTGNNMSMVFASCHADSNRIDTLHRIDLSFDGSNTERKIYGYEGYGINQHYILGQLSEPKLAPLGSQRMVVPELYNGIDLQYYSNKNGGLKYYFVVKPGADPRNIIQYFSSSNYTTAISSNKLVVTSSVGKITLDQPVAYQLTGAGTPTAISGSSYWHTYATNKYDFTLPSYTSSLTLIIVVNQNSPQAPLSTVSTGNLKWSTFSGGGQDDQAWAVTVDANGEQHMAGATSSVNYPSQGFQVIQSSSIFTNNRYGFYQKFDIQHKLIISSFIGGNDQTDAFDVEVNSAGDAYIVGATSATNFITQPKTGAFNDNAQGSTANGAREDWFIVKFNNNAQYVWGTYLGGTKNDRALSCTIDNSNNVYIVGYTDNGSLTGISYGSSYLDNTWNGGVDGILTKFNSSDSLIWLTYYGGSSIDQPYSCKVDASNNLFVSGATYSSNFPTYRASSAYYKDSTLAGAYDMFMLKFNSSGVRQWSSYFGGTGEEGSLYYPTHKGIAIDQSQNIYFADNTTSSDMYTKRASGTCYYDSTFGGRIDAFILKFNSSLTPQYCTYVGKTDYDYTHAIAFDGSSNLYLSYGTSNSGITNTTLGNYYNQSTIYNAGLAVYSADNFLMSLYSNLNPRWATYFGGTSYNAQGDEGTDIAIKGNDMYLSGYCNSYPANPTTDVRFPIFYPGNPAYIDSTYNDQAQTNTADAFISLFDLSQVVGVEELFKDNSGSLLLFPNPTNSALHIKFNSNKQEKIKLSIFTIDGKMVFETMYPTVEGINLIQINTNNLSTGMYIVKIDGEEYSATEKFVKYE